MNFKLNLNFYQNKNYAFFFLSNNNGSLGETQNLKLDENTTVLKCQSGIISIRYHAKCRHFKKGASNNLVPRALRMRSSHSSGPWGRGYALDPKTKTPLFFCCTILQSHQTLSNHLILLRRPISGKINRVFFL